MNYFFNYSAEEIRERGYEFIGYPALLLSGAPIDSCPFFEKEISLAVKKTNPNLKEVDTLSIHSEKIKKRLEGMISLSTEGKREDNQYFYIIYALKKINS